MTFALTPDTARAALAQPSATMRDLAFQTLLRHRIAYGASSRAEVGILKAGEDGLDPPYTAAGKQAGERLYTHAELDHAALFDVAGAVVGDVVMTYDHTEEVCALAAKHGFETHRVAL